MANYTLITNSVLLLLTIFNQNYVFFLKVVGERQPLNGPSTALNCRN